MRSALRRPTPGRRVSASMSRSTGSGLPPERGRFVLDEQCVHVQHIEGRGSCLRRLGRRDRERSDGIGEPFITAARVQIQQRSGESPARRVRHRKNRCREPRRMTARFEIDFEEWIDRAYPSPADRARFSSEACIGNVAPRRRFSSTVYPIPKLRRIRNGCH